jgi:hypothetical protein
MEAPFYAQISVAIRELRQETDKAGALTDVATSSAIDRAITRYQRVRETELDQNRMRCLEMLSPLEEVCEAAADFRSIVNSRKSSRFGVVERARYASAVNKLFKLRDVMRRRAAIEALRGNQIR